MSQENFLTYGPYGQGVFLRVARRTGMKRKEFLKEPTLHTTAYIQKKLRNDNHNIKRNTFFTFKELGNVYFLSQIPLRG